jgi:ATP-dependent RNA helicase DeaD
LNTFQQLGLSSDLTSVLDQLGFEQPTDIQQQAIPKLLGNQPIDFIGLAQTGTGKTAAYGLPLLDLVDPNFKSPQALIMTPTRELGQQIAKQLSEFSGGNRALNVEVVYGGAAISNQIRALKKPTQVIVATPGRLFDLIKRKAVNLTAIRYLVLDEADEMLNMGFKEAIDEILEYIPEDRSIWLFSATMPAGIRRIVKHYMDNPIEVSINTSEKINKDIEHQYVITKSSNKVAALRRFLDLNSEMRGILFCRTKRETQQIADDLANQGYGVEALHGDLSQAQRDAAMKRFKARAMQLLIATDVAARGIDVDNLTHVFHHTLPDQLESYTHRSGRTARAGKKGISLAFINPREGRRITELERKNQIRFQQVEVPSMEDLTTSRMHNWANLIVNTKIDDQADAILADIQGKFANLSKDDLLKRLITSQLDHVLARNRGAENLNEPQVGKKEKRQEKTDGLHRYFVNIGRIDGVTPGDLIHFLSDVSNVERQHFSQVTLQKNYAFFYLDKNQDKGFANHFKGLEIEGHVIRVNRDDTGNKPDKIGNKKKKGRGDSRKSSGRRRHR